MDSGAIQIGAVARQTGLSVDAIRFYERERLVASPMRTEGGFRLFHKEDVQTLHFIKSAQELGFSLDEIRDLISLRRDAATACPRVRQLLTAKLAAVQLKIANLRALEAELKSALEKCISAKDQAASHFSNRLPRSQ